MFICYRGLTNLFEKRKIWSFLLLQGIHEETAIIAICKGGKDENNGNENM